MNKAKQVKYRGHSPNEQCSMLLLFGRGGWTEVIDAENFEAALKNRGLVVKCERVDPDTIPRYASWIDRPRLYRVTGKLCGVLEAAAIFHGCTNEPTYRDPKSCGVDKYGSWKDLDCRLKDRYFDDIKFKA